MQIPVINWKKLGFISLITSIVFFILTVIIFYFYANSIDEKYSMLVKREINNFHTLQNITIISNRNYFILHEILRTEDTLKVDSLATVWKRSTQQNSNNFDKLSGNISVPSYTDISYRELVDSRNRYLKSCDAFFMLGHSKNKKEKADFYINDVNLHFINYQTRLEEFVNKYKAGLVLYSNKITSENKESSFSYILLGFSPMILSLFIMLLTSLFIVGFIIYIHFRPIEGL